MYYNFQPLIENKIPTFIAVTNMQVSLLSGRLPKIAGGLSANKVSKLANIVGLKSGVNLNELHSENLLLVADI